MPSIEPHAPTAKVVAHPTLALRLLNKYSPHEISEGIEFLIDLLDLMGGDPDLEEDDGDSCDAGDDGCGPIMRGG